MKSLIINEFGYTGKWRIYCIFGDFGIVVGTLRGAIIDPVGLF
jgi:hypothetical protein